MYAEEVAIQLRNDADDWLQEKEIMTHLTVVSNLQSYSFEWRTLKKKHNLEQFGFPFAAMLRGSSKYPSYATQKSISLAAMKVKFRKYMATVGNQ